MSKVIVIDRDIRKFWTPGFSCQIMLLQLFWNVHPLSADYASCIHYRFGRGNCHIQAYNLHPTSKLDPIDLWPIHLNSESLNLIPVWNELKIITSRLHTIAGFYVGEWEVHDNSFSFGLGLQGWFLGIIGQNSSACWDLSLYKLIWGIFHIFL